MSSSVAIAAFVVCLVVALLLHELGHLVTARLFGMRADRYFVGFGPTLWSTRRGEVEVGVKALPLGGFVSIRGMSPLDERRRGLIDDVLDPRRLSADRLRAAERDGTDTAGQPTLPEATWERLVRELRLRGTPRATAERIVGRTRASLPAEPTVANARTTLAEVLVGEVGEPRHSGDLAWRLQRGDEGRFYGDRPRWQRAIAIVTGPVTHVALAFVVLVAAYLLIPLPTGESTPVVADVLPDSPAAEAGLSPGDEVLAVDDEASGDYERLREAIRERPGEPTVLTVARDGRRVQLEVVPRPEVDESTGDTYGLAGFVPEVVTERASTLEALRRGAVGDELIPLGGVWPMLTASVEGLASIFSPEGLGDLLAQATGQQERDAEGAMSIVGAASIAGQTATGPTGLLTFALLFASINIFLFLFNLVPLPPFDGGHLTVLLVERVANTVRGLRGRSTDYTVDPRTITAVAVPVIGLLLVVFFATLWLDLTDPLQLG